MTTESFIQRAKEVHGDKYDYSFVTYCNVKTKVQILCPKHGLFEQTPDKHLHGPCGCPACAGNQRSSASDFEERARKIHGDKYDYTRVRYVNNRTPVEIICCTHGVFKQTPSNHLLGKGCPFCANNVVLTTSAFVEKARRVHGDKYDYSQVDYHGNRQPVRIICREHGVFEQIPYVHLNGCGCPVCGRINMFLHRDESEIHAKAERTFLKNYGVKNPMFDPDVRAHHKDVVSSDEVRKKRDAARDKNDSHKMSKAEILLGELLRSVFGDDDVLSQYKSDVYPTKCDFYIKSRDLYIELNAYWSHGYHWYSGSQEDLDRIAWWKSGVYDGYYEGGVDTFTRRDVLKRETARRNQLNYVVFWKSDLSDARLWIELGCPDGQDWLKEYSWLS